MAVSSALESSPSPETEKTCGLGTISLGAGFTFFIGTRGITINVDFGVAHGSSSNGQIFARGSAAGLSGLGLYGGVGLNGSLGYTSQHLITGFSSDKVLAAAAAAGTGGEIITSTGDSHGGFPRDPSITGSAEGGLGGYIGAGERQTFSFIFADVGC
ncbi:hypothetical protein [Porphyrobacter sp. GA68]|uniref:hypothetical protein n=1 Tax=Porphyrobacter sp. GA68 TaxID=2883480 RepID=UPI001D183A32|nr:hypothetical protein [Porphyrobacter sp. GA68]